MRWLWLAPTTADDSRIYYCAWGRFSKMRSSVFRMVAEIGGVLCRLRPPQMSAPVEETGCHVGAVAHAEQQRARAPIDEFVQFARRVHDEAARHHLDLATGRAHAAATGEAEIDLGRLRVAMIRADLARLPACDGDVTAFDTSENLLDVPIRIPLL